MLRASPLKAPLELGLPRIERPAAPIGRCGSTAPTDELIGAAQEAVECVHGWTHLGRKPARRPVEGRVVTPLHALARPIGGAKARIAARAGARTRGRCSSHTGLAGHGRILTERARAEAR